MGDIFDEIISGKKPGSGKGDIFDQIASSTNWDGGRGSIPKRGVMDEVKNFSQNFINTINPLPLVTSPVETIKGMYDAHATNARQAVEAWKRGDKGRAAQEGMSAIPLVGPLAEGVTDQIRSGDYSGAVGTLTGIALGPQAVKRAPAVARATAQATRAGAANVGNRMVAKHLDKYARAVDAGENARDTVVPRMIDEGIVANKKGSTAIEQRLTGAGEKLATAVMEHGGTMFSGEELIRDVQAGKGKYMAPDSGVVVSDGAASLFDQLSAKLAEAAARGRGKVSAADAAKLRHEWDAVADSKGAYADDGLSLPPESKAPIYRAAADALRNRLAGIDDIGVAAADESYLLGARGLIENAPRKPLFETGDKVALAYSAVAGSMGRPTLAALAAAPVAVRAGVKWLHNPSHQTASAVRGYKFGQMLGGKAPQGPSQPWFSLPAEEFAPQPNVAPKFGDTPPSGSFAAAETGPAVQLSNAEWHPSSQPSSAASAYDPKLFGVLDDRAGAKAYLKQMMQNDTPDGPVPPRGPMGAGDTPGAVPPDALTDVFRLYESGRIPHEQFMNWLNSAGEVVRQQFLSYLKVPTR
jgi:hypothetical protein